MVNKEPRTYSDMPIPPGEVLEEELDARGMTQKELAARLGRPAQTINEIIGAKKSITPETALGLAAVLGIDAQFWINLETDYRMALARKHEQDMVQANVQWLDHYPIGEMLKRGWIEAGRDRPSRLKALMNFLGVAVAEPQAYQKAAGFRITDAAQHRVSLGALAAWLRKGELDAQRIETGVYDTETFKKALIRIRKLTTQKPSKFLPSIRELCADSGVAFCTVQELPKSGANGATRWLSDHKALIQISLRNKWADIFWFTFFHEAYHVLKHRAHRRFLIDGLDADPEVAGLEAEADGFARDFLIPPREWNAFCDNRDFSPLAVRKFARSVGIAPFIVAGRLQKEKYIPYSRLTNLKPRYKWIID